MNRDLSGKVALVTGAARGIGRAVALELANCGADVIVNDSGVHEEADAVADAIKKTGRQSFVSRTDVSDRLMDERMFEEIIATFGRIDILVNNAARRVSKSLLDLQPEDFEQTWAVALWGVVHCTQLAARLMAAQGGGAIVTISSVHAFRPYPNASPYNGAKAAVGHMAASWALELAPKRVRVNVVEPGWVDTPGERQYYSEQEIVERGATLPMGRLGKPEEIAKAVAFLVSEDAAYITGTTIRVDGGFSLKF